MANIPSRVSLTHSPSRPVEVEKSRRKRDLMISLVIIAVVVLLTVAEIRIIRFGSGIPLSNTVLMFILININLLLLVLLIFLVFRNLVKLFYDRRQRVMGATLRSKLVMAFIALTLLPTTVLFFFSINFITSSISFWFNVPLEGALENSLQIGRGIYQQAEDSSAYFLERISEQLKAQKQLDPGRRKALSSYILTIRAVFNLEAIEVYSPAAERLAIAVANGTEAEDLKPLSTDQFKGEKAARPVWSMVDRLGRNECVRTIGPVPFDARGSEVQAYLVLTVRMAAGIPEKLAAINRGFEEYQQFKLLKEPVQSTYYITLSVVALLVVFCAVWFGFYLAKSITIPLMELAEGTRRVAEGDLDVRIATRAEDEIGSLVEDFNRMIRDLRSSRMQLEHSARMLAQQNSESEKRRRYIEIVLRNVSAGVITLDAQGGITTVNKSAEKMLYLRASALEGRNYRELLGPQHLKRAAEVLNSLSRAGNEALEVSLRVTIAGRPCSFLAHVSPLMDDNDQRIGIVTVFDDLTDLEKAQRMAAWREVARRIAHEVKNPLTPISLSAQRLKRRYATRLNEPVFEECTQMIIDHVELIRNLVNEFSAFARFPTANPQPCELLPIIEETISLYREGHEHVRFEVQAAGPLPHLNLDRQQIKQAMINLVDNAVSAIREKGMVVVTASHDPALRQVRLEVADNGEGIPDDVKLRMFEPNFSTKTAGMGLGLTIVSTIIADHHGRIYVLDNQPRGARFVIELPA